MSILLYLSNFSNMCVGIVVSKTLKGSFFYLGDIMTMRKLHEHYPGAIEQTVAGLVQLAAEEACMGKSPLPTYMVLADVAEEYGLI